MKPELSESQALAVDYLLRHPYSIIALDPGMGKSRVSIEYAIRKNARNLIVGPSYAIDNWVDEIRKWAPKDKIVTTFKKGSDIYDVFDSDFVITSYDLAQKAEYLFEWCDMLTIEEAHNIKNIEAKRTEFLHRVTYENSIPAVVQLTGTPIKNRVAEYYSLLAVTYYDPNNSGSEFLERFPSAIDFADYFSYRIEYDMPIGNRFVKIVKWKGVRRIAELKKYLKGRYLRIKSDLPPVSYIDFKTSNTPDKALLSAFTAHFKDGENSGVNPTEKAQAALKKAPITAKYAEDLLDTTGSVLIYSDHVEAAETIAKYFGVTALTGKINPHKRMEMAKKFQSGEGLVLVATIGALSNVVTLTRSNHLILNDYPWVPGDLKQVMLRINRLGQDKKCVIHRMIGSPQDEYIMQTIEEKLDVIDRVS